MSSRYTRSPHAMRQITHSARCSVAEMLFVVSQLAIKRARVKVFACVHSSQERSSGVTCAHSSHAHGLLLLVSSFAPLPLTTALITVQPSPRAICAHTLIIVLAAVERAGVQLAECPFHFVRSAYLQG